MHSRFGPPIIAQLIKLDTVVGDFQEVSSALDALTRKLALPSPDTPHNQTESKPAIEAIEVDSEAIEASE